MAITMNSHTDLVFYKFFAIICVLIQCAVIVNSGRVKRVVGGILPRVASLRNATDQRHLCGATLLTSRVAVTAAHCVHHDAGEYLLLMNNVCVDDVGPVLRAEVVEKVVHEGYDKYSRAHDIAILKIRLDIQGIPEWLNDTILPRFLFGLSGECLIAGYGVKDLVTKETSEKLLAATVELISLDECYNRLGPVAPHHLSGMLCVLGDGVDTSKGDSGGPLLCGDTSAPTLEGICSHGLSCEVPGLPAVYTSVAAHLAWIETVMEVFSQ